MADSDCHRTPHGNNFGRIGREAELKAWLWLTQQGYEIFDNIFPNGPIDFIAVHSVSGEIIKIDVKTVSGPAGKNTIWRPKMTENQAKLGVRLLIYFDGTREFELMDKNTVGIACPRDATARAKRVVEFNRKKEEERKRNTILNAICNEATRILRSNSK